MSWIYNYEITTSQSSKTHEVVIFFTFISDYKKSFNDDTYYRYDEC